MELPKAGQERGAGDGRDGQVIRGLLAGAFWGLVTGVLVLVVAAVVIENRRQAALPPEPPVAGVEALAAPAPVPPAAGAEAPGTAPQAVEPHLGGSRGAPRPDPVMPGSVAVALAPPPPPPAPAVALTLPRALAPAPEPMPVPQLPAEPVAVVRQARPGLAASEAASAVPAVALDAPGVAAAAPTAIPAPQLVGAGGGAGDAPRGETADPPPARAPLPPAPFLAGTAPGVGLPLDATGPGSEALTSGRPRIAFVVEGSIGGGGALPGWAQSRAGIEPAVPAEAGTPEPLRFADGAWRGEGTALFPDRADPAGFLTARAAGAPAWLAYDRLTAATPDLGARLDAAAEHARRDGAVAVLVAADPALLGAIDAWLATKGSAAPVPVPLSALH